MIRPRLAFFTPLNPDRNGVSDYSEELLPHLARYADVDLILGGGPPSNPAMAGFRRLSAAEFLSGPERWDAAIYQIGNHFHHHRYMMPCLEAVPGIVVLHDYCLHYLVLGTTLRQGRLGALSEVLRPRYGSRAETQATRLLLHLADPTREWFGSALVRLSRGVIVNNAFTRDLVLRDCPEALVETVGMGVPWPDEVPREALRRKHGVASDDFVLASISTLSYTKRLGVVLAGFARARRVKPRLRLLVVGAGSLGARLRRQIEALGLGDAVHLPGWVPWETYRELIALADLVVDLRYPSGGETSASLARALASGTPAILSAQGSFLELPDDLCVKIAVGAGEIETLSRTLVELSTQPERRAAMSRAAREYAREHQSLDRAARQYVAFVERVMAGGANGPLPERVALSRAPGWLERALVSPTYKLCRTAHLFRSYGLRDTLRRIREERRVEHAC